MVNNKEQLIKTLNNRSKAIRRICTSGNTLDYLSIEERCEFTRLSTKIERQIREFSEILKG